MNAQPTPDKPERPDITPAQGVAALGWVAAQAVAFGWLSSTPDQLTLSLAATGLAVGWKVADAIIRHGRAGHPAPPGTNG